MTRRSSSGTVIADCWMGLGVALERPNRTGEIRQDREGVKSVPLAFNIHPDFFDRAFGLVPGSLDVAVTGLSTEWEVGFVRTNPVGQHAQAQEHMLKSRCRRERRSVRCPGRRKPVSYQQTDTLYTTPGMQCTEGAPDGGVFGPDRLHVERSAVVRQRSHEQGADRLPVTVVPRLGSVPPPAQGVEEPVCGFGIVTVQNRRQINDVSRRGGGGVYLGESQLPAISVSESRC